MLRYTGHVAFAHALHKGADLRCIQGVFAPRTLGFFHERILAATVLGGIEHWSQIQVDSYTVEHSADSFGERANGIFAHSAHLLGARRVLPLRCHNRDAVHVAAFLVGGHERLDSHVLVDGADVIGEFIQILQVIFHHQVSAEFVLKHERCGRHVHHHHLCRFLLDRQRIPQRQELTGKSIRCLRRIVLRQGFGGVRYISERFRQRIQRNELYVRLRILRLHKGKCR